jgi:hypothetical protein
VNIVVYLYSTWNMSYFTDNTSLLFYKDFKKCCGRKYQLLMQKIVTFLQIMTENTNFRIPKQMTNLVTTMTWTFVIVTCGTKCKLVKTENLIMFQGEKNARKHTRRTCILNKNNNTLYSTCCRVFNFVDWQREVLVLRPGHGWIWLKSGTNIGYITREPRCL